MANYRYLKDSADAGVPVEEATLTQRVYDILRDEIMTGALSPGYRLVRRKESERLGVSRMAVTEALLKLEIDGFVESRPLYGSRVRPLTIDDVKNDEVLREALECQSAQLAAENATDQQLAELMKRAKKLDHMITQENMNSKAGMEAHFDFHVQLARSGGFERFAEELQRVWFRRLMRLNWIKATYYKRVPENWHQLVVRACQSRDPQIARDQMREHVRFGNEDSLKALKMILETKNGDGRTHG